MSQLNPNQKHFLRLARQGADQEGWSKISEMVWTIVPGLNLPPELITIEKLAIGGRAKLTDSGKTVLDWL